MRNYIQKLQILLIIFIQKSDDTTRKNQILPFVRSIRFFKRFLYMQYIIKNKGDTD
jgi:hypothetical protein